MLLQHARLIASALRPPLAPLDADLAWLDSIDPGEVGIAAAYRAHDGARSTGGIFARLPVTVDLAWPRLVRWLTARAAREELGRLSIACGEATGARYFPLARLWDYSLSENYDGADQDCLAIDTGTGELLALTYHETYGKLRTRPLGITWSAYLTDFLQALAAGNLKAVRDDSRVLKLESRPPPATVGKPSSDAEVLLQLLGERQLLQLTSAPSPELMAKVAQALRKRTPDSRITAVRAALAAHEEVDEDYARDEELAALIELVRGG